MVIDLKSKAEIKQAAKTLRRVARWLQNEADIIDPPQERVAEDPENLDPYGPQNHPIGGPI